MTAHGGDGIGNSRNNACDCELPLACHESVCSENCFSHSECGPQMLCPLRGDYFCGFDNTCVPSLSLGESCDESIVCPECDFDFNVCDMMRELFIDNLDNNRAYCITAAPECYHLGTPCGNRLFHYLSDMQNAYLCEGKTTKTGGWVGPTCQKDMYGIQTYPYPRKH